MKVSSKCLVTSNLQQNVVINNVCKHLLPWSVDANNYVSNVKKKKKMKCAKYKN